MIVNSAAPTAIRILVRRPAGFWRYSRSMPIAAPRAAASSSRQMSSTGMGQRSYSGLTGTALADLLPPHRVIEPFPVDQFLMPSGLDNPAALEHVDAVGVQDRREPVRDQHGDRITAGRHIADGVD